MGGFSEYQKGKKYLFFSLKLSGSVDLKKQSKSNENCVNSKSILKERSWTMRCVANFVLSLVREGVAKNKE